MVSGKNGGIFYFENRSGFKFENRIRRTETQSDRGILSTIESLAGKVCSSVFQMKTGDPGIQKESRSGKERFFLYD